MFKVMALTRLRWVMPDCYSAFKSKKVTWGRRRSASSSSLIVRRRLHSSRLSELLFSPLLVSGTNHYVMSRLHRFLRQGLL